MSDYTQITLFTPKDALATGNPAKKIKGSEFDPEFSAISTAVASKYDSADLASEAQAAALTSDTTLLTPAKLSYALQNATVTLGANVLLNGGIAASDVARLSASNVFTGTINAFSLAGDTKLRLSNTSAAANSKHWLMWLFGSQLRIGLSNDADPTAELATAIQIIRSGTTATTINLGATAVTANGNTIWHAGNSEVTDSGTYAPSFSNTSNIDTVAAGDESGVVAWNYARVGNVVTVSGWMEVNATNITTLTGFNVTLPIATTFSRRGNAGGVATRTNGGEVAAIYAEPSISTTTARVQWVTAQNSPTFYTVHFTYLVQ